MGRVTNEQLAGLIGGVDDGLVALAGEVNLVKSKVDALQKTVADANGRQRRDHDKITKLETKVSVWGAGQAAWSTLVGVIAGWVGMQR